MFGMPSTKREGQTMLNMCMEQCEGVYLMDEIERLREALRSIASNTCCDRCQEAALVARAALQEKSDG